MPLLREKQLLAQGFKRKNGGEKVKTLSEKSTEGWHFSGTGDQLFRYKKAAESSEDKVLKICLRASLGIYHQ